MKRKNRKDAAHDHYVSIASSLSGVSCVLDAPAGEGMISRKMKDLGYDVTPVDIIPGLFKPTDMSCKNVDLNKKLPFDNGTFDLVLCREGIEHLENQFKTIRNFRRVLKPSGWLLISTPNLLSLRARFANMMVGGTKLKFKPPHDRWNDSGGDHINLHNYFTLRAILRRNGFLVERATTFSYSLTSLALAPLVPLVALFTRLAFRREKDPAQQVAIKQILKHSLSRDLLFGKKLIILARRES